VSSLNPLSSITHGSVQIRVQEREIVIDYVITFTELFCVAAVLSALFVAAVVAMSGNFSRGEGLALFGLLFLWFSIVNRLLGIGAFERMLREAAGGRVEDEDK
jgi:hypothetical protein